MTGPAVYQPRGEEGHVNIQKANLIAENNNQAQESGRAIVRAAQYVAEAMVVRREGSVGINMVAVVLNVLVIVGAVAVVIAGLARVVEMTVIIAAVLLLAVHGVANFPPTAEFNSFV